MKHILSKVACLVWMVGCCSAGGVSYKNSSMRPHGSQQAPGLDYEERQYSCKL